MPDRPADAYPSWGRFPLAPPARAERPGWRHELPDLSALGPVLPYGKGRSYGDACLNGGGTVLDTSGLHRLLAFDREAGVVRCEAGVTLGQILEIALPAGWFLPVTPGTKYVTVGGAIAHDVHGKNHHGAGTFGRFVPRLELARSDDPAQELTPDDALFQATVGGLGLTGLIIWADVQLIPVGSPEILLRRERFRQLDDFFPLSEQAEASSDYVVAWIDALSARGRGVLMQGDHAPARPKTGLPGAGRRFEPRLSAPLDAPGWALSPPTMRAFNEVYYRSQTRIAVPRRVGFDPFFYPLDQLGAWNKLYGKRGFLQFQSVVPPEAGLGVTRAMLGRIAKAGAASFLAVLKVFGGVPSPGMLSFPRPGVTLALDLPHRGEETLRLVRDLNAMAIEAGGALYPAKDALMTPEPVPRVVSAPRPVRAARRPRLFLHLLAPRDRRVEIKRRTKRRRGKTA